MAPTESLGPAAPGLDPVVRKVNIFYFGWSTTIPWSCSGIILGRKSLNSSAPCPLTGLPCQQGAWVQKVCVSALVKKGVEIHANRRSPLALWPCTQLFLGGGPNTKLTSGGEAWQEGGMTNRRPPSSDSAWSVLVMLRSSGGRWAPGAQTEFRFKAKGD